MPRAHARLPTQQAGPLAAAPREIGMIIAWKTCFQGIEISQYRTVYYNLILAKRPRKGNQKGRLEGLIQTDVGKGWGGKAGMGLGMPPDFVSSWGLERPTLHPGRSINIMRRPLG